MSCHNKNHAYPVRPDFSGLLRPPFTCLIMGAQSQGKSVTGHSIAEWCHGQGRNIEILTFRHVAEKKLLPDWMKKTNIMYPKLLPDHIILFDETQLRQHARDSMKLDNVTFDKLATLSRQRNISMVYITQDSFRIDRNLIALCDIIIFKKPRLMSTQLERQEVRVLFQNVYHNFVFHCPGDEERQWCYVLAEKAGYEGWVGPVGLPSYWCEELSTWTRH